MSGLFRRKSPLAKRADKNLAMSQVLHARKTTFIPRLSQLRQLPRFLSKKEQFFVIIGILLITFSSITLVFHLLNANRISIPAIGGEYTEGLIGTPQLINPLYASTNDVDNDLTRLIFSGLMRVDETGNIVPDLAESCQTSSEGTKVSCTLRDDAKWHDGENVTVNDVVFTYSAIKNIDYNSPLRTQFSDVTIRQTGEQTFEFTLDEARSNFFSSLTVGILPSHLWQDIAPTNATLAERNKKPIGSGPYTFEKLLKDSKGVVYSYELSYNDNFYREGPYIKTLTFKFYSDVSSAIDALKNQNVEGISYLPLQSVPDFENENNLQLFLSPSSQYIAAFFNADHQPILKDLSVRKALSVAIDKQQVVDSSVEGHAIPIDSFLLNQEDSTQIPSLETAKQLLDEAGWVYEDGASIRSKDGTNLELQIVTLETSDLQNTATSLQEQWSLIGVSSSITVVTAAELQNSIIPERNYDIIISGELYPYTPDYYAFWHSSQATEYGFNLANFSNPDADDLIESGRAEMNSEKRATTYQELSTLITEEYPAVFLYQSEYSYITSDKIQNIQTSQIITPADRFNTINQWYIKTKKILKSSLIDGE